MSKCIYKKCELSANFNYEGKDRRHQLLLN